MLTSLQEIAGNVNPYVLVHIICLLLIKRQLVTAAAKGSEPISSSACCQSVVDRLIVTLSDCVSFIQQASYFDRLI